ncbi:MAG: chemotaxis protein CheB [bacterium]
MATLNPATSVKKIVASKAKPKSSTPPVVAIGASAGGLEALTQFFEHVPLASGLAYVVIQHLDPTYKGMLPELLQRATPMEVSQVTDQLEVKPNCVYVIPPNKDMSILQGVLHLREPAAPRGLRLPIDSFFRALAEDQREMAIGVILSGMGSDGTLGLRAIKEKAGLALVQEPASAKFNAMPLSAINAGLADIVAPMEELPGKIITYLRQVRPNMQHDEITENKSQSALEKIVILLRERTGNDFSLYKKNTIYRRIERRMSLHQIDAISNYVRYLRENPQEQDLLFKELLIGVTNFFRDPQVWGFLKNETLPALFAANPNGKVLRAWVPACSTGEEAYSLAIIFQETLERLKPKARYSLQIFATDLDHDAIDKARQGVFPTNIAADVSAERLSRFFITNENSYQIGKEIRGMVIFAPQNIIMDPPFTKLDILSCRNLMIYLGPELQAKLIPLFHYALNRDGILLLGSAETTGSFTNLFAPLDSKVRLYRHLDNALRSTAIDFPVKFPAELSVAQEQSKVVNPATNLQFQADQFLLQRFTPAAVLVNAEGDILYINGRTGKYLEPAAGKANWNIYAMARDSLRPHLTSAFKKVVRQTGTITLENLRIEDNSGAVQTVNVTVQSIDKPELLHGMVMIIFTDVATPAKKTIPTTSLLDHAQQAELERVREDILIIREEMQTSQEELTATNEELQSTNEELQSTNEELTTSKEEMQSLNEELQTVNTELQSKVDDLSLLNNDMKNLLDSTDIATVFLDEVLHVRRFTIQATHIFKLIAGDIGRPLSDIVTHLHYPELQQDAHEVLRTLIFSEKQITTDDGRWLKVRIMPYRTLENVIDGVVITFTDITSTKKLEAELRLKIGADKK